MKTFIRVSKAAKFITMDYKKKTGVRKAKTIEILTSEPHKFDDIKTRSEIIDYSLTK